jgi:hypothetical protein
MSATTSFGIDVRFLHSHELEQLAAILIRHGASRVSQLPLPAMHRAHAIISRARLRRNRKEGTE